MASFQDDIKHLFMSFYNTFLFCEGFKTDVDINTIFKSAKILEDTVKKLQNIKSVESFQSKLDEFWKIKGLSPVQVEYFQNVSHLILVRYLSDKTFSDSKVGEAVNKFILLKSECEFLKLFKEQLKFQNHLESLKKSRNFHDGNREVLSTNIYLLEMKKLLLSHDGSLEKLSIHIKNIIQEEQVFRSLLHLLCLPNECDLDCKVQDLVSISISDLLSGQDSHKYSSLILDLKEDELNKISKSWPFIFDSITLAIESSIQNLQCSYSTTSYSWVYTGTTTGISFDDIISLILRFRHSPNTQQKLTERLTDLKIAGFDLIVEDIMRIAKLN